MLKFSVVKSALHIVFAKLILVHINLVLGYFSFVNKQRAIALHIPRNGFRGRTQD